MRPLIIASLIALIALSCNISQQTKDLKTLADCQYTIVKIDSVFVSGTDVAKLIERQSFNLGGIPSLALGFLSKNIPLNANLTLEIFNPTENHAAINYFDYEILVNKQSLLDGTVDKRIDIGPNETKEVDFQLNTNIYKFLVNDSIRNDIQEYVAATQQRLEQKATVTIRVKPAIYVGDKLVKYPGFIDIKKELRNTLLIQ